MTTASNCPICGYPIAPVGIPWGYAGPVCGGHPQEMGRYWFTPAPTPTADEIRRIVREEIERAKTTASKSEPAK